MPQVLKRTSEQGTHNSEAHGFWVPAGTPEELNSISFVRKFIDEVKEKYGMEGFVLSPNGVDLGSNEFLSEEISSLTEDMGIFPQPGTKFRSHCLRLGILSEFVLCSPPVHPFGYLKENGLEGGLVGGVFLPTCRLLQVLCAVCAWSLTVNGEWFRQRGGVCQLGFVLYP